MLFALCGACNEKPSESKDRADTGAAEPCSGVFEGDYFVRDQEELNALAEYCEVTGSLSVYGSSLTSISLPQITAVGGALSVLNNDSLTSFSLPDLKIVGDSVTVEDNDLLALFTLPALTEVGEGQYDNVFIKHNDALTAFDLSALTRVSGSLFVRFDAALTSFDLSALTGLGGFLGMTDNENLAQCLVDALVAQVESGEGIGDGVDNTGGPNNPACTCEEVEGVLQANCP